MTFQDPPPEPEPDPYAAPPEGAVPPPPPPAYEPPPPPLPPPPAYAPPPAEPPPAYAPPPAAPPPASDQPPAYGAPAPGYGQPQAPGYGQVPAYAAPAYAAPQNGQGTTSLVTGILGLLCCGLLSIVAVITGMKGQKLAAQGLATNGGSAKAGLILGWIGIGLWILGTVAWILLIVTGNHTSTTY